jgi:NAD/NADP transhydrogenase beta subunit
MTGTVQESNVDEAMEMLTSAKSVIITPGYGSCCALLQRTIAGVRRDSYVE